MADVTMADPFRSFKFSVVVNGAGNAQIGFQKVSGLKESSDVVEYREGNQPVWKMKLPGLTNYDPVTLTKGATNNNFLFAWREGVARYGSDGGIGDGVPAGAERTGFRRTVDISLYDKGEPNTKPVRQWRLHLAWPSELSVSDLNAEGSEVLIETLVLQHEGLDIIVPARTL